MNIGKVLGALAFITSVWMPNAVFADASNSGLRYGLSYVGNYSSCASSCRLTTLDYADDQIDQLDAALNDAGLTKLFKYAGNQTQSTDITEDYYRGYDNIYGDAVELYAVTTHGGIATNINNERVFMATYCTSGNANYSSDLSWDTGNCNAVSNKMILGEQSRTSDNTYSSHTGSLRWLILSTCHSLDETPSYWVKTFKYGLDYLLGYKDTATLGESTDECLADFAVESFEGTTRFKDSWFEANDDWWIDNTAAVMTCTDCTNNTSTYLSNRLNNYTRQWPKREMLSSCTITCSWAYHEG